MSKTLWRKKIVNGTVCLVPDCIDAAEWLNKTKLDVGVMIEPRRPRNTRHHQKLFVLLNLAVHHWPENDDGSTITKDALLGLIKIKSGLVTPIKSADGTVHFIPKSINFESMDQTSFEPFYQDAIRLISKVLGVSVEDLEKQPEQGYGK